MSVVLQSLLHNPLLRNYFLADMHNPHRCARRLRASPMPLVAPAPTVCLACDMDELFTAFFSGDHAPFLPDHFLYSMWTHAEHLAGYAQQDAHELLMAVIDGIHTSCVEHASNGGDAHAPNCRCVIHTVFGGTLRSDVSCDTCHTNSTAMDAILDLSLDVAANNEPESNGNDAALAVTTTTAVAASAASAQNGSTPSPSAPSTAVVTRSDARKPIHLLDCLARFTRVEKLFHNDKFFCSKVRRRETMSHVEHLCNLNEPCRRLPSLISLLFVCSVLSPPSQCQKHEDSTKQMSFHALPLVLCLHLKRFDHQGFGFSGGSRVGTKIDQFVAFPLVDLDLAPYRHQATKPSAENGATGAASAATSSSSSSAAPSPHDALYDLFCVIVHKGTLDTGHYLCYLRQQNHWYRADDRHITRVDKEEVANCSASG